MKLNCVVTENEPIAQETLVDYIGLVPGLNIIASCRTAADTLSVLRKNEVDVLFIDIHMAGVAAFELLRNLQYRPAIVFTTVYAKYPVLTADIDVVDYLLKPISIDHFLRAVDKVYQRSENVG